MNEITEKEKEFICERYEWYCPVCKYGYIRKDYDMPNDYEEWNCLLTEEQLKIIYGIYKNDFNKIYCQKLERLEKRINESSN